MNFKKDKYKQWVWIHRSQFWIGELHFLGPSEFKETIIGKNVQIREVRGGGKVRFISDNVLNQVESVERVEVVELHLQFF